MVFTCAETIRSCGFFFDIFEAYHEHGECMQFPNDIDNPNSFCVGHREVVNVRKMKLKGREYRHYCINYATDNDVSYWKCIGSLIQDRIWLRTVTLALSAIQKQGRVITNVQMKRKSDNRERWKLVAKTNLRIEIVEWERVRVIR